MYYTAGVGIVYDRGAHTQQFFQEHSDDITCLAMHPDRRLFASGQVAAKEQPPCVCLWDSVTLQLVQRIEFPAEEHQSYRMVVALAFSPRGDRLAVVTGDDRHTVWVYDWRTGSCTFSGVGKNGRPPQVFGLVWHPFLSREDIERDPRNARLDLPEEIFVTYGDRHIKFWLLQGRSPDGREEYQGIPGKFGRAEIAHVHSACFLPSGLLVTGGPRGDLLMWDATGRFGTSPG